MLARRTFTEQIHEDFALLSGDYNPLHMSDHQARRLLFGKRVVHGVHLALWACDSLWGHLSAAGPLRLSKLLCTFRKPVGVGETATLKFKRRPDSGEPVCEMEVLSDEVVTTVIRVEWSAASPRQTEELGPTLAHAGGWEEGATNRRPREWKIEELKSLEGSLALVLDKELAAKLFPMLAKSWPAAQLAGILAATRLVGMHCPGLHSVFSSLELKFSTSAPEGADKCASISYSVEEHDERFRLAKIKLKYPGMLGVASTFVRQPLQRQCSYLEAQKHMNTGEFSGQRALVVGGSRGLGEVVSKLLAAGGADVRLTYHRGAEEAREVVQEILAGGGRAASREYNILLPEAGDLRTDDWAPSHLYYFATPFIAQGMGGRFNSELFGEFCNYYVTGFAALIHQFVKCGLSRAFYPSTSFLGELPANMSEYVVAKGAGEALCAHLEKQMKGKLVIYRPRLPKLATDQTASLSPIELPDSVPLILDHLRRFVSEKVL